MCHKCFVENTHSHNGSEIVPIHKFIKNSKECLEKALDKA